MAVPTDGFCGCPTITMDSTEEVVSFLDVLDLDEEIVDIRLKSIMLRSSFSNGHLTSIVYMLKYKHLINQQEENECENHDECTFLPKLFSCMSNDNIDIVCKITNLALSLNPSSILSNAEHLLQQILCDVVIPSHTTNVNTTKYEKLLLNLKICNSILNAVTDCHERISLWFLNIDLEQIIFCPHETLKKYFFTNTIPKFFETVLGYHILDKIWIKLKTLQGEDKEIALRTISTLADFFVPAIDENGEYKFISEMPIQFEFWDIILYGLNSSDPSLRKISIYLAKRTIDYFVVLKKNINIKHNEEDIFSWCVGNSKALKHVWDSFFVLMESLEEKQSNIVLPSLQFFHVVDAIGSFWLNCAFSLGLKHDNTLVRLKCIDYRLRKQVTSEEEAVNLLEALNDINLYDNPRDILVLKEKLSLRLKEKLSFKNILKSLASVKWSPVPFYHLSDIISNIHFDDLSAGDDKLQAGFSQIIPEILKVPCNNIILRTAVHMNIAQFVKNCIKEFHWIYITSIYSSFNENLFISEHNPLNFWVEENLKICNEEKVKFLKCMTESHVNLSMTLLYLNNNGPEDFLIFRGFLNEKIRNIHDVVSRQYADKRVCLQDILFIINLHRNTLTKENPFIEELNVISGIEYNYVVKYLQCLLMEDSDLSIEDIKVLFKSFSSMCNNVSCEDEKDLLDLYKAALTLLQEKTVDINKKVLGVFVVNTLNKNNSLISNFKHEMLTLKYALNIVNAISFDVDKEASGRLRNVYFEQLSQLIHSLQEDPNQIRTEIKETLQFIEKVTDIGGYGCLIWVLRILNILLPIIFEDQDIKIDLVQLISQIWREIEELKSSNQYSPCIKEFIHLITQDVLTRRAMYNNVVIYYCNKIIEDAAVRNTPLFYLVNELCRKDMDLIHGQIMYIYCEILLFSPVLRRDQRITEDLAEDILGDRKLHFINDNVESHFNYQIQHTAVGLLCKITNPEVLGIIASFLTGRIDEVFKNKERYHGNSQHHRTLLTCLQHLIIIALKNTALDVKTFQWCLHMLGKLPHQPSVKLCLEWYIALGFYMQNQPVNEKLVQTMKESNVPLLSQFAVLYWLIKHKITSKTCQVMEYDFVMDTLLSHAMGPMFNIRLHAQYYASQLYNLTENRLQKYSYTIQMIENTFVDGGADKNFIKLKSDFFANEFDILACLTPTFLYYFMPKYCDFSSNKTVDKTFLVNTTSCLEESLSQAAGDFRKEWFSCRKYDKELLAYSINRAEAQREDGNNDLTGTIQKKYVPWRNMSDVDAYELSKKKKSPGDLIVVASLIDKLPNLGGMARTSEVFGVNTYVIDSLRHLQDKQFQGLSVSAERWINVEEVRPGESLKRYLMQKKAEGYSVVAAEQTSTSSKLQDFKFPKKTILLLGHEKEGIPCNLLPLMDHCVEIPQHGFVRSLNVHVTAAIFVWEYSRQNML